MFKINGVKHKRTEDYDGIIRYYVNGLLHREDGGPTIIFRVGSVYFHKNGIIHREDGPAVETYDGNREWWLNGKKHCLTGPAVDYTYHKSFWIDGIQYNTEEFWRKVNEIHKTAGHL